MKVTRAPSRAFFPGVAILLSVATCKAEEADSFLRHVEGATKCVTGLGGASDVNMASQLSHETGHATHQTYLDYYGDWWDANYGGGEKAAQHEDPRDEAFLGSIERLANLAAARATELLGGWPSAMSLEPASVPHGPWSRYGGGGSITDDRWMG